MEFQGYCSLRGWGESVSSCEEEEHQLGKGMYVQKLGSAIHY